MRPLSEICATLTDGDDAPAFTVEPNSQQHKKLRDLRAWERNRLKWDRDIRNTVGGRRLLELAAQGKARPYQLGELAWGLQAHEGLTAFELRAVEWLLAAQRGFGSRVLFIRHEDFAVLLGCSVKTAGNVMRRLAELGLVERRTHFRAFTRGDKKQHAQLACSYRATARLRKWLSPGVRRLARLPPRRSDNPSAQRTPSRRGEASGSPTVGTNCQPRVRARTAASDPRDFGAANALARLEREQATARRAIELRARQAEAELAELERLRAARAAVDREAAVADGRRSALCGPPATCTCGPCVEARVARRVGLT